jgi:UDP-GlcNAc:undecaprenyl-phosphate GlcNAc-1-phosphate transferase
MPLGLVVAAAVMALPVGGDLGAFSLLAAAPVAGLPILDTILVVFSRLRRGAQVLSGHRDHLTHRLRARLGSARAVARLLGAAQGGLCLLALVEMQLGRGSVAALTAVCVAAGAATIWLLELPGLAVRARPAQQESSA